MDEFVYVDLTEKEESKKDKIVKKVKAKLNDGKEWVKRNKEAVIVMAPFALSGLNTIIKVTGKRSNLRKEEQLKDLYCYDRSMGHYWRLKRKLSNKEWIEVNARKKRGERIGDILDDLKVLK